jgi:hypothetical protein
MSCKSICDANKYEARIAELKEQLARNVLYRGSQYRTETPPEVERRSREILEERHNPDCSDEITEY